MNNFTKLPSGRIIQTDDIIFVGKVCEKYDSTEATIPFKFSFKITWATGTCETLNYNDKSICMQDWSTIQNSLLKTDQESSEMIFG